MTVEPNKSAVNDYLKELKNEILTDSSELWTIGKMTENIDPKLADERLKIFSSINNMIEKL